MSRVLLSGFRVRVLDANGHPDVYPCRIVFTDSSTTQPKAVYSGPLVGDPALGTIVNLDAQGFGPANGIWLGTGEYNLAIEHNVGETLSPDWQIIWTTNHVQGGFDDSNVDDTSIRFVKSVPDIRGLSVLGGIVFNVGYYELNDGGQGEWRWMKDSLEVDDGGAYLIPTGQSTSTAGRWHRVIPSGGEVDVRMWGAVTGQPDVSGNIELAQQWCSRTSDDTGITLAFPAGSYNISTASLTLYASGLTMSGSTRVVNYHIYNNARFVGTSGVAELHVNGPTIIDSTSSIISAGVSLYLGSGSVPYADERWFNNTSIRSRLLSANAQPMPIYLDEVASIGSTTSFTNKLIIGPVGGVAATATITYKGGVEVLGNPRIALGVGTNGQHVIKQSEIMAWWFGYGSLPADDQAVALSIALQSGSASNSTVVIDTITSPKGIYSQCGSPDWNVQARVTGVINLYNGANLFLTNVQADRKKIFNVVGTSAMPVTIGQGVIYPEWFGATMNSNCNNAFHWMMQCFQRTGVNLGTIRWIDGGGSSYTLTETIYLTVGGIGLRDMTLITTTETSSSCAVYVGGSSVSTNYEFKDVLFQHTGNGDRRPTILFEQAYDVYVRDCRFNVNHGIALSFYGGGRAQIYNNLITLSNGGILYSNPTLKPDASNIEFYSNVVYGINNTMYGSTATVQTLPAIFANIYNNKFIGEVNGGTLSVMDLCRDSTYDTTGTGQVQIHNNMFMDCSLNLRTKGLVTVTENDFRGSTSVNGAIYIVSVATGESVNKLRVVNNNAKVAGTWTNGYMNMSHSAFLCCVYGNTDGSLYTHASQIKSKNVAAVNNGSLNFTNLFPYAQAYSFQMTMLTSELTGPNVYTYAPCLATQTGQNQYPTADSAGRLEIDTTRATYSGNGDNWIQWSCQIGTSKMGPY